MSGKGQMHVMFVYGTLQKDEPNYSLMVDKANGSAVFIGYGHTVQSRPLIIGSEFMVPFLLDVPDSGERVRGEIYEVDETMLAAMDALEAHPILYERILIDIEQVSDHGYQSTTEQGTIINAWCYVLKNFKPELLELKPYLGRYNKLIAAQLGRSYQSRSKRSKVVPSLYDCVKSAQ